MCKGQAYPLAFLPIPPIPLHEPASCGFFYACNKAPQPGESIMLTINQSRPVPGLLQSQKVMTQIKSIPSSVVDVPVC